MNLFPLPSRERIISFTFLNPNDVRSRLEPNNILPVSVELEIAKGSSKTEPIFDGIK